LFAFCSLDALGEIAYNKSIKRKGSVQMKRYEFIKVTSPIDKEFATLTDAQKFMKKAGIADFKFVLREAYSLTGKFPKC
jgi:hypothetical protein